MARTNPLLLGLALGYAALQLGAAWLGPYELFHDEAYYWACAQRLGFGYVDHPPLAPWLLAASQALLGDGRLAFEVVPALCGAATLLLTGGMARRLGAGRFGQLLAGLAVAAAPVMLVMSSFYSVNAIEILLWTATCFLVLELIRGGDERLWLGVGALAGIGLLNKHTFALLGFGLAVGVLATPLRARLRSPWPWAGLAVALLLASPNLVWNLQHGWPSLDFYRSRPEIDLPTSVAQALVLQVLAMSPANVLVWLPGVLYLLFARSMRPYRPFGVAFLTLFAVIVFSGQRRADRVAGIYPVVLAAGAVFWDQSRGRGHRVARPALAGLLALFGVMMVPATLPVLPPKTVAWYYAEVLGQKPDIEASDVGKGIPLYLQGRLEWERFADEVAAAWEALPPDLRERTVVLAPHWLYASVVEYHDRDRRLPPVVAPHNAYWFWRNEAGERDAVVAVAVEPEVLALYFTQIETLHTFRCEHCALFRPDLPIVLGTDPVRPLSELLAEWRHFGILPAPALRR